MRKRMGTFRYDVGLGNADGSRFETVSPWVDTGALYSQFPASMLEGLGHKPDTTRRFRLADGSTVDRAVGDVPLRVRGEVQPVLCVYGKNEDEMRLGRATLGVFSLAPDPVNETLTPIVAMLL